jgi:hypothetical protein
MRPKERSFADEEQHLARRDLLDRAAERDS